MCENGKTPDQKEPDLFFDKPIGGMKKIERAPGMKAIAPPIRWGLEYQSWPIEKRLRYAERLASSMNHAADKMQEDRNRLAGIVRDQEEKLKAHAKTYLAQGDLMHKELGAQDAEKQKLYSQIVGLSAQVRKLKKENAKLKESLAVHGDLD